MLVKLDDKWIDLLKVVAIIPHSSGCIVRFEGFASQSVFSGISQDQMAALVNEATEIESDPKVEGFRICAAYILARLEKERLDNKSRPIAALLRSLIDSSRVARREMMMQEKRGNLDAGS